METYPGRDRLAKDLNLDPQATTSGPLLSQLVHHTLSPASRQLKFSDTSSSSHTVTTESPHVTTAAAGSDTSRGAVAFSTTGGVTSPYSQKTPTLHPAQPSTSIPGLGTLLENDSEQFSQTMLQNDKHFKLQPVGLNSNENSNREVALDSKLPSQTRREASGLHDSDSLGIGLGPLQSSNVYAELGETFVNSADSSLDVDKLVNASTESERLRGLLKPSSGDGDPSRDELDDFFDSSLPSALQDSNVEDQLRSGSE